MRPVLLALIAIAPAFAAVHVWEGTLTLPTSEEAAPDPNPPFDQFAGNRFNYPYTLRENLTGRETEHAWRAIFLENEYLKCTVLPDIGGHLYTCIDKISGQPMFYANPSIKKANIGYRGAWAAFGIEFNFPVSHNWVSMSPVDFSFEQADGSGSVTVGNIDRVYGMQWKVELVLQPASTVLEERVTLYNRSDVRHRFYWWNNAGVRVWDDSRICYPMRYTQSHGFTEINTWPVDMSGMDLSIIRNQTKGPVSVFVYGSREPFMGVYHPHTNTGVVHYADYGDLPGKKIWSWGVDADGLDWRRALSDNNSAYVEVQAGPMRNQETYAFLEPRQSIHFSEFWMPVRGLGGIARANLAGVVNMERDGGKLRVSFNANRAYPGVDVRILDGDKAVVEQHADLAPEHTWAGEVPSAADDRKYTFELRDTSGKVLLRQTEGEYDWTPASEVKLGPQHNWRPPAPDERTADDWLETGKDHELNGALLVALDDYAEGLRRIPGAWTLRFAAGRLCASLARYREAIGYLTPVESRDTSSAEVAYYLGIAYDGLGEERKARAAFENAQRGPAFHAAGCLRLAELLAREGDLNAAERYLAEALRTEPGDVRSREELAALRHDQLPALAATADSAHILNRSAEYIRLGMYRDALEVLSRTYSAAPPDQREPGVPAPDASPLVAYYRGWCRAKLGESAAADYEAASRMSTAYVFPSRPETEHVLRDALKENPKDATAHFLLGTWLAGKGVTDSALIEWNRAREINPRIPVLDADMGRVLLYINHEPGRAAKIFEEGLPVDPSNEVLYAGLDQALSVLGRPATDRVAALSRYPDRAKMPVPLVYELALNRAEAGDFDGAEAEFRNRFFARQEGGTNVREVWVEVRLMRALAEAKAGKCDAAVGVISSLGSPVAGLEFTRDGMDQFTDSARVLYLSGTVERSCGQNADAVFKRAAASSDLVWACRAAETPACKARLQDAGVAPGEEPSSWRLYENGLVLKELGRTADAQAAFQESLMQPDQRMSHHLARLAMR